MILPILASMPAFAVGLFRGFGWLPDRACVIFTRRNNAISFCDAVECWSLSPQPDGVGQHLNQMTLEDHAGDCADFSVIVLLLYAMELLQNVGASAEPLRHQRS